MRNFLILIFLTFSILTYSQESPNYQNKEYVFNSGGNPAPEISSTNYKITLSSIGDGLFQAGISSSNYQIDSGFINSYPPPEEVLNLMFVSKTNFIWDPEKSVGTYNVYRGFITDLPSSYGSCFAYNLTSTNYTDSSTPPAGQCYFYLVTAKNRLAEEGTMGRRSDGQKRQNTSPCP